MLDAFKPKTITREVRGVHVTARSMTLAEAIAHQDRVQKGEGDATLMAGMAARLCTVDGAPVFTDEAEAMQSDSAALEELVALCMEANGAKGGKDVPLP